MLLGVSAHPVWVALVLSYVLGFRLGLAIIVALNFVVDVLYGVLDPRVRVV